MSLFSKSKKQSWSLIQHKEMAGDSKTKLVGLVITLLFWERELRDSIPHFSNLEGFIFSYLGFNLFFYCLGFNLFLYYLDFDFVLYPKK